MTDKELLLEFVSKTQNLDKDAVAALIYNADGTEIKSDALTSLLGKQGELVSKLKSDTKKFDDGYKKAQKEVLEKFEKELKEKFEIDSDEQGLELVEAVVKSKTGDKTITADEIKKSVEYVTLEKELKRTKLEADKKVTDAVSEVTTKWNREKTLSQVHKAALEQLDGRKPILSNDADKANRQKGWLLNDLNQYEWEVQGEGAERKFIPKKDGKAVEDNLGNQVDFATIVTQKSDLYFDFAAADDRSAGGDPNKKGAAAGGTGGGRKLIKPTSQEDWFKQHEAIEKDPAIKAEDKSKLQIELRNLWKGDKATA